MRLLPPDWYPSEIAGPSFSLYIHTTGCMRRALLRLLAAQLVIVGMATPMRVDVPVSRLERVVRHTIAKGLGYSDETEAATIADILLYAQIRGNSQGVIKLITDGVPRSKPGGRNEITTEFETKLSARLNGNGVTGMLVMNAACELAVKKAQEHGFGIVATHGTSSGTGAIGYFGHSIAKRGLLGFVFSQSPEFVAPFGAYEPVFGTNPFSIGIPMKDQDVPLVLDMATSAIAWFNVKQAKTAGVPIPGDVAYDKDGKETADPTEALMGALRVFDRSYKGSHIALMVEILSGPLAGGDVEDKHGRGNWGNLVFAIDPEMLGPADVFKDKVQALLARVKGAKKLPGVEDIYLPGERSEALAAEVQARGSIALEKKMWEGLQELYRATGGEEAALS